jgi:hypothetical protein
MKIARPDVQQERLLVLARRYPVLRAPLATMPATQRWHRTSWLTRCLLGALGLAMAVLANSLLHRLQLPVPGLVAGAAAVATAEWLIARRRLHASGIEEMLWAAGSVLVVIGVLDVIGVVRNHTGLAIVAATLCIAGLRLLNPLLTTAALVPATLALALGPGAGVSEAGSFNASLASFALAFFALAAGAFRFERPSFDRMLDWAVVALPVLGFAWSQWNRAGGFTWSALRAGDLPSIVPAALLLTFGVAALVTGLLRRSHAPLFAALACLGLFAVEVRAATGLATHWQLIAWGGVVFLLALAAELHLRTPRNGITSRKVEHDAQPTGLLQMAGAAMASPSTPALRDSAPGPAGQGGDFGGGGASGRF